MNYFLLNGKVFHNQESDSNCRASLLEFDSKCVIWNRLLAAVRLLNVDTLRHDKVVRMYLILTAWKCII